MGLASARGALRLHVPARTNEGTETPAEAGVTELAGMGGASGSCSQVYTGTVERVET